jgi:hypothetical protein
VISNVGWILTKVLNEKEDLMISFQFYQIYQAHAQNGAGISSTG